MQSQIHIPAGARRVLAALVALLAAVALGRAVSALSAERASAASGAREDEAAGAAPAAREDEAAARGRDGRPNFVVVMTDDQDLRSLREMPIVRRGLANDGTSFRSAAATFPICAPGRATFLTGQYSHNNGVEDNGGPAGQRNFDDTYSMPLALKRSGYRTGLVGKYINGYRRTVADEGLEGSVPPGWSSWEAIIEAGYFDWEINRDGRKRVKFGDSARDYETDALGRLGEDFIDRSSGRKKDPFFLYLSVSSPHGESGQRRDDRNPRPAPRHRGIYDNAELPKPPSFNEKDVSDKPRFLRVDRLKRKEQRSMLTRYRGRMESLLSVDEMVGRLRSKLKRENELKNTVFIFTSDNGFLLGEHRLEKKKVLYEESVQIPLVISGPGFKRGKEIRSPVGNIDIAPTILDAAGVDPLRPVDGIPLQRIAADPGAYKDREILYENRRAGGENQLGHAIRTNRFVFIAQTADGERYTELYDLKKDPYQLENRSGDAALADVETRLATRLAALEDCAGASCR